MNPILKRNCFLADPEAHKMPDGRLYLYGSLDQAGAKTYCSLYHRVYSTNDPKLESWTDHGVAFSHTEENPTVYWRENTYRLSAPDAIHKNGKYYMYICSSATQMEGVAVSDTPYGPFENAQPVPYADGDGIDPAVFVDDDGSAYLFWGQFNLRGAKLNDDMRSLDLSTVKRNLLTEREHGFHEGASIRKRGNKYYLVYVDISRGAANCLSYAMADSPLGPYEKKGVVIDTTYCDPGVWNTHGSIEEYAGQWYVFYHRSSQGDKFSRRTCAEKIYFNEDGTIDEVEMTSQGASDPLDAFQEIDASVACRMKGNCFVGACEEGIHGETLQNCGGGNYWKDDWAEYKYLDFGNGAVSATVYARGKGVVKFCGKGDEVLGCVEVDADTFTEYTAPVKTIGGIQPLWIGFEGRGIELRSFVFAKKAGK